MFPGAEIVDTTWSSGSQTALTCLLELCLQGPRCRSLTRQQPKPKQGWSMCQVPLMIMQGHGPLPPPLVQQGVLPGPIGRGRGLQLNRRTSQSPQAASLRRVGKRKCRLRHQWILSDTTLQTSKPLSTFCRSRALKMASGRMFPLRKELAAKWIAAVRVNRPRRLSSPATCRASPVLQGRPVRQRSGDKSSLPVGLSTASKYPFPREMWLTFGSKTEQLWWIGWHSQW